MLVYRAAVMAGQCSRWALSTPVVRANKMDALAAKCVAVSECRCNLSGSNGEMQEGSLILEVQAKRAVWRDDHVDFRNKLITKKK